MAKERLYPSPDSLPRLMLLDSIAALLRAAQNRAETLAKMDAVNDEPVGRDKRVA